MGLTSLLQDVFFKSDCAVCILAHKSCYFDSCDWHTVTREMRSSSYKCNLKPKMQKQHNLRKKRKVYYGKNPRGEWSLLVINTALHKCAKFSATSLLVGKYCGQLKQCVCGVVASWQSFSQMGVQTLCGVAPTYHKSLLEE